MADKQPTDKEPVRRVLAFDEAVKLSEPPLRAGSCVLADPKIAEIVQGALLFFERKRYFLLSWCIMPNHVHAIFAPLGDETLSKVLHSWKSFTANAINKRLGRSGAIWERESFDHVIRSVEDVDRFCDYVEHNAVQAGMCASCEDWPFCSKGCRFEGSENWAFVDPRKISFVSPVSRGELPHLPKPGCTYFVTFRLWDAIGGR